MLKQKRWLFLLHNAWSPRALPDKRNVKLKDGKTGVGLAPGDLQRVEGKTHPELINTKAEPFIKSWVWLSTDKIKDKAHLLIFDCRPSVSFSVSHKKALNGNGIESYCFIGNQITDTENPILIFNGH